jgi:hypothetical protein
MLLPIGPLQFACGKFAARALFVKSFVAERSTMPAILSEFELKQPTELGRL